MLFSHISDTHLGLSQYNSEERENDIYDAFRQAIDISIRDHVDFVIFAGDIFHTPSPGGTAIMHMAHALKRLKQNSIDSFFILGEHDISRMRAHPVPYVYHKLGFSRYIGEGEGTKYKDVLIVGFDKIRKSEMRDFEEKFRRADSLARGHRGHRILVMHQGLTEVNKFAGELGANDLPKEFTYYAMGHLHDRFLKTFSELGGPLAYPGSTELTTTEGIKDAKKGFYEVDISTAEARPTWVELPDRRPQLCAVAKFENMAETVDDIIRKFSGAAKKPIVELRIQGRDVQTDLVQAQISRLLPLTLHCAWKIAREPDGSSVLMERPAEINDEMLRLAAASLKSERLAGFAIKELLPLLTSESLEQAGQMILENYKQFREEAKAR